MDLNELFGSKRT